VTHREDGEVVGIYAQGGQRAAPHRG
jgi:hypothetical protein